MMIFSAKAAAKKIVFRLRHSSQSKNILKN